MTLDEFQNQIAQNPHRLSEFYSNLIPRLTAHLPGGSAGSNALLQVAELKDLALDKLPQGGKLFGVPVVVKDNIHSKGFKTTCASRILQNYWPTYESTAVSRLKAAGAVIVAKSNLDEFAMGSSGEFSAFGAVRNPRNPAWVPGGSSSGSAAIIVYDDIPIALGSDTGGSVRLPGAFCGIVGYKPTYGTVSRYGLTAFASSLDVIGLFTHSAKDAATVYNVMGGYDAQDATSSDTPFTPPGAINPNDITVGWVKELCDADGIEPAVKARLATTRRSLESHGIKVIEVSLSQIGLSIPIYQLLCTGEVSSNLLRFDGVRYGLREEATDLASMYQATRGAGFGAEVKRRIILGTYILSHGYYDAYFKAAQRVRRLFKQDFDRAFGKANYLLSPTAPTGPFNLGERVNDPVQMYLTDICTIGANLAGIPAISIPAGVNEAQKPIGIQLMAPLHQDMNLLAFSQWMMDHSVTTTG